MLESSDSSVRQEGDNKKNEAEEVWNHMKDNMGIDVFDNHYTILTLEVCAANYYF